ncbi:hypothetical protein DSO06_06365 [Candidatus Nezhaarchaeota archaeon WYZ-LMO8]|nr:MAG: hypothetical protein DSO06_06365 [Candidatus Nezhaarchaeota archaeon WYZ-LMO8]TDA35116.1 MAG: hypothetical protein DSO05_05745 [Candidatus Nezhaarchaeota archaeon WYZ-LMO7]
MLASPSTFTSSRDVVVLPVLKKGSEGKVYLLWKDLHKLSEFYFDECGSSGWMPKVSIAYGEIIVIVCPSILYRLADVGKPTISGIEVLCNETLTIKAEAYDEQSALHKVFLVYSINNSPWNYKKMDIARRYVMEPVGVWLVRRALYY